MKSESKKKDKENTNLKNKKLNLKKREYNLGREN